MLASVRSLAHSCVLVAAAVSLSAAAQDTKPQIERVVLEKHDQSDVPGKEVVLGVVTVGPGAVVAFHTHPGDEAGYIVKGSVIRKVRGQPDQTLKAGDSFFNSRGTIHAIVGGDGGGTIFSSWIVDKGKPISTPAP